MTNLFAFHHTYHRVTLNLHVGTFILFPSILLQGHEELSIYLCTPLCVVAKGGVILQHMRLHQRAGCFSVLVWTLCLMKLTCHIQGMKFNSISNDLLTFTYNWIFNRINDASLTLLGHQESWLTFILCENLF